MCRAAMRAAIATGKWPSTRGKPSRAAWDAYGVKLVDGDNLFPGGIAPIVASAFRTVPPIGAGSALFVWALATLVAAHHGKTTDK